jgi:biopolymer transport protein ExbD
MALSTAGSREINVTPLIDVLLVLLVIFLIIIPIMLKSLTVELPPKIDGPVEPQATVGLKLEADLSVSLDDGPRFPSRELPTRLRAQLGKAGAVFIDSSDAVPWGLVVSTVDTVRGIALDTNHDVKVAVRVRDDAPGH